MRRRQPPRQEWGTRLSSISSIVSNLVIGIASVTIAGASLYFTIEFNRYQRLQNERTVFQEEISSCVDRAQLVVELIRSRSEIDAINIIQDAAIHSKHCNAHGINLSDIAAIEITKNPANIDEIVLERAHKRISRPTSRPESGNTYLEALKRRFSMLNRSGQNDTTFPVVSAVDELLNDEPRSVSPGFTNQYTENEGVYECERKLQELMRAKPEDKSWTITCPDGSIRAAASF